MAAKTKRCPECGVKDKVTVRRGEYEYQSLPGTILRNVEFRTCAECGAEAVAIPAIEQLDEMLASEIVRKPSPLTPAEFHFLRKYLGWSGKDTAKRMGVEPETVSRWEHGERTIGKTPDRLIRTCVMLESPVDDYSTKDLADISEAAESSPLCMEMRSRGWAHCA